jgi:hypothetical protein
MAASGKERAEAARAWPQVPERIGLSRLRRVATVDNAEGDAIVWSHEASTSKRSVKKFSKRAKLGFTCW